MTYRVGQAKDGRVLILGTSGFAASKVNEKWERKILFSAVEQSNEFTIVRDINEAKALYEEACKALGHTLQTSA